MNKPDWKDAPEWANYLAAEDCDGEKIWCWFEFEPIWSFDYKAWLLNKLRGRYARVGGDESTLEKRPS